MALPKSEDENATEQRTGAKLIAWVFGAADNGRHELTVDSEYGCQAIVFTKEDNHAVVFSAPASVDEINAYAGRSILTDAPFALLLRTTPTGQPTHHIRGWAIGAKHVHPLAADELRVNIVEDARASGQDIDPAERYEDAWPLTLPQLFAL